MKPINVYVRDIELKSIPHGEMTLEQVINSEDGKEAIRLLKKTINDPKKRIIPFLVAYQIFDIESQLNIVGLGTEPGSSERTKIITVSATNVVENLASIISEIGQEGINKLTKNLS